VVWDLQAAIIGAAGSVIGLASDIAGSIRIPALYNGIYGHKPSPGEPMGLFSLSAIKSKLRQQE
jgi:Asp-tRNA(Asn)/Glu-tRNA(Gln) amidotransferase A subunit family amidase